MEGRKRCSRPEMDTRYVGLSLCLEYVPTGTTAVGCGVGKYIKLSGGDGF